MRYLVFALLFLVGCSQTGPTVRVINECPGTHYDRDCYAKGITNDQIKESGGGTEGLINLLRRKHVTVHRGTMQIRIRGAQGDPLFVIDDVPTVLTSQDFFGHINPEDIESLTVVKGSDAAMYGVRGGNGVIVIRTKR